MDEIRCQRKLWGPPKAPLKHHQTRQVELHPMRSVSICRTWQLESTPGMRQNLCFGSKPAFVQSGPQKQSLDSTEIGCGHLVGARATDFVIFIRFVSVVRPARASYSTRLQEASRIHQAHWCLKPSGCSTGVVGWISDSCRDRSGVRRG